MSLMIEPTAKQIGFAQAIADELGIDLPEENTVGAYHDFIAEYEAEYYESRRKRLNGYDEAEDRFYRRMRGQML